MQTLHEPLITPAKALEGAAGLCFVDCRFRLDDPTAGRRAYADHRLSGARFLDLEADLSGPIDLTRTGRHPFPSLSRLREAFAAAGIPQDSALVFYDDAGGAFAARAWWSAAALGHRQARVLDGGLPAWDSAGGALDNGPAPAPRPAPPWHPQPSLAPIATLSMVQARVQDAGGAGLLDARALPRFRGEVEPIDPVAGHIPGAACFPHSENLTAAGRFKDPAALRARWETVFNGPEAPIAYCGSGVTAAHNLLAMAAAGLCSDALPALYVGSFSEWIRDPARPVARGDA
jgi:thiosulfate/3-mercaptopyruvate sulfurtransferase